MFVSVWQEINDLVEQAHVPPDRCAGQRCGLVLQSVDVDATVDVDTDVGIPFRWADRVRHRHAGLVDPVSQCRVCRCTISAPLCDEDVWKAHRAHEGEPPGGVLRT